MEIKKFKDLKEQYKWLVENKAELIADKMGSVKNADSVNFQPHIKTVEKNTTNKEQNEDEIKVSVVINTTNIMDSHDDVHIKGIWDDSLTGRKLHLQEHERKLDKIISETPDDLEPTTKEFTWKELNVDAEGTTQALVFNSNVKKSRNPYMFEQYKNKYVKNHSVGMRYVDLQLAINDNDYKEEYEVWNKYVNEIVNKDLAEQKGYFFAVTKADFYEGSAVAIGSNIVTPTLETKKEETLIVEKEEVINNSDVYKMKTRLLEIKK